MKSSVLSKAIGSGVISFNLALLPLVPVFAQTSNTSGTSTIGSSNTPNDVNLSTAPTNATTNASTAPTNATTNTTTPSTNATTNTNTATTSTVPSQGSTSTKSESNSNWGVLGLLGMLGLAGLFRQTTKSSTVDLTNNQHQTSVNSASVHLQQGFTQTGVEAHSSWERLKARVSSLKERRAKAKEIKEIKNALGRPSNRVILDKQDHVILNVGDLITHQAVESARAADMLDVLLESVDAQEPEIANEERRAPVSGEASLEEHEHNNTVDGRK